jgi:hypothetical protein
MKKQLKQAQKKKQKDTKKKTNVAPVAVDGDTDAAYNFTTDYSMNDNGDSDGGDIDIDEIDVDDE